MTARDVFAAGHRLPRGRAPDELGKRYEFEFSLPPKPAGDRRREATPRQGSPLACSS
jgi:hypothetical protein